MNGRSGIAATGVIVTPMSSGSAPAGTVSVNVEPSAPVALRVPPCVPIVAVAARAGSSCGVTLRGAGGASNGGRSTGPAGAGVAVGSGGGARVGEGRGCGAGVGAGATDVMGARLM